MRAWIVVMALGSASVVPAQAVPAQADACPVVSGAAPPQEPDAIAPGFGSVFVLSPPADTPRAPRNVEIRLTGDLETLDAEPPTIAVQIDDARGEPVPFARERGVVRPLAPLPPRQTFTIRVTPTDAHPCPDCVPALAHSFTTGDDVDLEPPRLERAPPVHVFVMPSTEEAQRCGLFFGQTHQIEVDFGSEAPVETWIDVAARKEGEPARALFQRLALGQPFTATGDVGSTLPVALGDVFLVAMTPRDLAGNVGEARVVRVRARSFIDQDKPRDALSPLWCDVPREPSVHAPAALPTNGELHVELPFEEVPLALAGSGGERVPLVPISETTAGLIYGTAELLPAGERFDLVALACPHCVCAGCASFAPVPIVIGAGRDDTAPAAPVLLELRDDSAPISSAGGRCQPDRAALLAVIEPGEDDSAGPDELRYDANIRIDGGPPLALARSLRPFARGDGSRVVRIETSAFGRRLGDRFELTLEAIDAAGNRTAATTLHGEPEAAGCATSGATAPSAALIVVLACSKRRRDQRVKTV